MNARRGEFGMSRWMVLTAGLLGGIGVIIGAYAAHGLESNLLKQGIEPAEVANRLEQCDVAVRYHMLHSLALLVLGASLAQVSHRISSLAGAFFVLGILLFSGGLYSMVFLGESGHWAIVPSGGLCFIIGWFGVLLLAAVGKPKE